MSSIIQLYNTHKVLMKVSRKASGHYLIAHPVKQIETHADTKDIGIYIACMCWIYICSMQQNNIHVYNIYIYVTIYYAINKIYRRAIKTSILYRNTALIIKDAKQCGRIMHALQMIFLLLNKIEWNYALYNGIIWTEKPST